MQTPTRLTHRVLFTVLALILATTGFLAAGGLLRIATAVIAGAISLAHPDWNGALLGVAAWTLSYAMETLVSGWRLRRLGWFVEA